jgi:hypothetical protein
VQDSSGRLLALPSSAGKHVTLLSEVLRRPRQIALAKKGERSVGSVGARAPPKYKVCPLPTVRKPRYLHRTAHEIFKFLILRLFIGFRILAGRARLKASLFPHRRLNNMDFSNFDFDALDQATRDETLERLSYPVLPDFDWDSSHPIDFPDFGWQPTECQQTDWQQADASAYAPNEPQGAL